MEADRTTWLIVSLSSLPIGLVAIPMIRGNVGRNRGYGFRVAATLADDRVWYPMNRWMGWVVVAGAVVPGTLGLVHALQILTVPVWVAIVLQLLIPLVGTVVGTRKANRLKASLDPPSTRPPAGP